MGSPCWIPLEGMKVEEVEPFTKMEKKGSGNKGMNLRHLGYWKPQRKKNPMKKISY